MTSLEALGLSFFVTTVTGPASEPVTLAELKDQGSLPQSVTIDDAMFTAMVKAARQTVESRSGRALVNQTVDLTLGSFPPGDARLPLPRPPLSSITSIGYYDSAGSTQTMASSDYQTFTPSRGQGWIRPADGATWPGTDIRDNAVVVRYVAGYGSTGSNVPETLRLAVKFLALHWIRNREAVSPEAQNEIPYGVETLIAAEHWGMV